jgi:23S rRNA pseudouridine1911/1915/1917 synthase
VTEAASHLPVPPEPTEPGGHDHRTVTVPDGLAGERVDAAIARMFGLSRTRAAELIRSGRVTVDGAPPAKSHRVESGAMLDVAIPAFVDPVAIVPEQVEGIEIVHDDDAIVVIDKPVGVAVHPSPGWSGPTVVGHLVAAGFRISTSGAAERQGIVQRLDVGTSGVMVIAKSERAYSVLKNAFRHRTVDKVYHALVQGHPDPLQGTVDAPIGRNPQHDHRFSVRADGKPSITHYETLEAHRFASLLEVHLETGRTHQIRVHMAALKHPCLGDLTYGADPTLAARVGLTRQWLHAVRLGFEHPESGEYVEYSSDYPADLQHALDALRDAV